MKKIKEFFQNWNGIHGLMANGALAFANNATTKFCYYIFHQPKMPEELVQEENSDGEIS